jgi:hypothetical protein
MQIGRGAHHNAPNNRLPAEDKRGKIVALDPILQGKHRHTGEMVPNRRAGAYDILSLYGEQHEIQRTGYCTGSRYADTPHKSRGFLEAEAFPGNSIHLVPTANQRDVMLTIM